MNGRRGFRQWANYADNPKIIRGICFFAAFALILLFPPPAFAQETFPPVITSPQAGQVVQGAVTVSGTSAADGFLSAEVSFAYSGDAAGTWFLVAVSSQPVTDGNLAAWDTTAISDGNYTLRLRVTLFDGTTLDALVPDLRVRNYTPAETSTPTITPTATPTSEFTATPLPTVTPTATPFPTPTPLPPNPAALKSSNVFTSLGYGALAVTLLFVLFGIYIWLRRH